MNEWIAYPKSFSSLADLLEQKNIPIEIGTFDDFIQNIFALSYPKYNFNVWHVRKLSHKIDEMLQSDRNDKFLVVVLPRYHLKSTICGYGSFLYRMLTSFGDGMYISYKDELCVAPDTKIRTPSGYSCIKDIKVGRSVLTHTGEYKQVSKIFKRYVNEKLLKITLDNEEIILVTKEHPILKDNDWILAENLKSGDFISRVNLDRKYDCPWKGKIIAEYFGMKKALDWGNKVSRLLERIKEFNAKRHTQVVNIEEVDYEGSVYNLEVRKNHSYVGKGIIFHNCLYHCSNIKSAVQNNPILSKIMEDLHSQSESAIAYKIGNKKVRIFPSGIFGVKRGIHTDCLVCADDLQGDLQNPMAFTELEKTKRIFNAEVINIPNKNCPLFVFGTVIDYTDLLFALKDNPRFESIWMPAIDPDINHNILWEEMYNRKWLENRKQVTGWKAFSTEFMLTPVMATSAFFTMDELDKVIDKNLKNYQVPGW